MAKRHKEDDRVMKQGSTVGIVTGKAGNWREIAIQSLSRDKSNCSKVEVLSKGIIWKICGQVGAELGQAESQVAEVDKKFSFD